MTKEQNKIIQAVLRGDYEYLGRFYKYIKESSKIAKTIFNDKTNEIDIVFKDGDCKKVSDEILEHELQRFARMVSPSPQGEEEGIFTIGSNTMSFEECLDNLSFFLTQGLDVEQTGKLLALIEKNYPSVEEHPKNVYIHCNKGSMVNVFPESVK